jgi:predicted DNA-binding ribbon-helix-helix protein
MIITAPTDGFIGPVKRSVTIAGHPTSISLEPIFWTALEAQAQLRALPLNALIAQVDALRIVVAEPPNLASALRSWLLEQHLRDENENRSQ